MEDRTYVTIGAFDSALTHAQETNKRLGRLLALALLIIAFLGGTVMYFLINYEIVATDVTVDSKQGTANYNYIGNDGDIDNGSGESQNSND